MKKKKDVETETVIGRPDFNTWCYADTRHENKPPISGINFPVGEFHEYQDSHYGDWVRRFNLTYLMADILIRLNPVINASSPRFGLLKALSDEDTPRSLEDLLNENRNNKEKASTLKWRIRTHLKKDPFALLALTSDNDPYEMLFNITDNLNYLDSSDSVVMNVLESGFDSLYSITGRRGEHPIDIFGYDSRYYNKLLAYFGVVLGATMGACFAPNMILFLHGYALAPILVPVLLASLFVGIEHSYNVLTEKTYQENRQNEIYNTIFETRLIVDAIKGYKGAQKIIQELKVQNNGKLQELKHDLLHLYKMIPHDENNTSLMSRISLDEPYEDMPNEDPLIQEAYQVKDS